MARTAESLSHAARADVVHISSRRFGSFEVPRDRVLEFPQGLIGFGAMHRFVILEHRPGSPFKWMLSVDDPELAFAVADPTELVHDYAPPLELAARILATEPGQIGIFVLVTIPGDPAAMTVNLMAPVAVDLKTRRGRQLILEDARCPAAYAVVARTRVAAP